MRRHNCAGCSDLSGVCVRCGAVTGRVGFRAARTWAESRAAELGKGIGTSVVLGARYGSHLLAGVKTTVVGARLAFFRVGGWSPLDLSDGNLELTIYSGPAAEPWATAPAGIRCDVPASRVCAVKEPA